MATTVLSHMVLLFVTFFRMATTVLSHMVLLFCHFFPDGNHGFIPYGSTFLSLFPDGNHGFIPYGSTVLSLFSRWQLFCHFFRMATTVLSHMVLLFCHFFPDGNFFVTFSRWQPRFYPIWFYCFVTFFQMATFLSLFPDGNHGFIPYGSTVLSLFSRWQLFCHFFQMATTVLSHMVLLFCQIMPELFSQWSHLGLESYVYTVKSCLQQQYWFHCLCYYNEVVVITVV